MYMFHDSHLEGVFTSMCREEMVQLKANPQKSMIIAYSNHTLYLFYLQRTFLDDLHIIYQVVILQLYKLGSGVLGRSVALRRSQVRELR